MIAAGLVVLALLVAVIPAAAVDRTTPVAVGDPAPALELGDQHGKPFRLADTLGQHRFVVLAFYPKAFTGG